MTEFFREENLGIKLNLVQEGEDPLELIVDPAFDTLHKFSPIGAYILKYYDEEGGKIEHIALIDRIAEALEEAGIAVAEREYITKMEHEIVVELKVNNLDDGILDD